MADDDEAPEVVAKVCYNAPTTRTLYRLTPMAVGDLTRFSRQIAIVAAMSETEARSMAMKADPFRQDWLDITAFASDAFDTGEDHVVGDVTFTSRSVPAPAKRGAKR